MKSEARPGGSEAKVTRVLFLTAAIVLGILTSAPICFSQAAGRKPASFDSQSFERARELLQYQKENPGKTKAGKPRKRMKAIPESSVVEYFQEHPDALKNDLERVVRELNDRSQVVDTTKHVRLIPPAGRPGYEELKIFVSHPYRIGDKRMPADNLAAVWSDFIRQAKKEIILNVYEFDNEQVAAALIEARKNKVRVQVGLDANVLKHNAVDRAMADRLKAAGIDVVEVDSVGLNHQKVVAIDWSAPDLARALFSSGNLTRSCLDPAGDLAGLPPEQLKEYGGRTFPGGVRSIPNANHVITMKSWLAANVVVHELTKTFSKELGLRGSSYPTSGAYQITGPGVNPQTFEAYPENSFIIAFTPGGGYRGVNKNILAYLIKKSEGPVRLVQFAFAAGEVSEALLERAQRDLQTTGKFDFIGVGDTPFAMQKWSQFLKMSGMKRLNEKKGRKKITRFLEDESDPWSKSLTADQMTTLRSHIHIAPLAYGKSKVKIAGKEYDVSAKIHHKLLSMGDFAVVGSSFNFSKSAETNNEQILVFRDPKMAEVVRGIAAELAAQSPRSVFEETERRMARDSMSSEDQVDDENVTPETISETIEVIK
jgi:phosphatidylserine/phosphatidylglycerophosphate/cardiolipin synthase-like enzyme